MFAGAPATKCALGDSATKSLHSPISDRSLALIPTRGDGMTTRISIRSVLLVTCGVLFGIAADRVGYPVATVAAQQGRNPQPATLESLAADVAQYQFNEMRGHIIWLTRKSPIIRAQDGSDVDIKGIFDGIDTSSLADVKAAIEKKDSARFAATYKTMLESCYSCHKAVGRPYLRPMIPTAPVQTVINLDQNATWPQ